MPLFWISFLAAVVATPQTCSRVPWMIESPPQNRTITSTQGLRVLPNGARPRWLCLTLGSSGDPHWPISRRSVLFLVPCTFPVSPPPQAIREEPAATVLLAGAMAPSAVRRPPASSLLTNIPVTLVPSRRCAPLRRPTQIPLVLPHFARPCQPKVRARTRALATQRVAALRCTASSSPSSTALHPLSPLLLPLRPSAYRRSFSPFSCLVIRDGV